MSLSLNLNQSMRQQLVMTHQMQQAIKLLQMTSMDLDQMISQEMSENPFLELADEQEDASPEISPTMDQEASFDELAVAPTQSEKKAEDAGVELIDSRTPDNEAQPESFQDVDVNWDECYDSYEHLPKYRWTAPADEDRQDFTEYTPLAESLYDHLSWQLKVSGLSEQECLTAHYLINNIDEDGYLKVTVEEAAAELKQTEQEIEDVLEIVQDFDPAGVGARDLVECLRLQLEEREVRDSLLYKILDDGFDLLQRRKFRELARKYSVDQQRINEVLKYITMCDPKPGRSITKDEVRYITPDVYVKQVEEEQRDGGVANGRYMYYLNEGDSGLLRVNEFYRGLMQNGQIVAKDDKNFAKEKYNAAVWLIRNLEKRKNTILRVTEAIMEHQQDFLKKGIEHLRPLTLKEIAEVVELHESTIARVTSGKYVDTPRGVFELKFFFSSHLSTDDGGVTSSRSVKETIQQLIEEEDLKHPLSDLKITKTLNERGIQVARRTVAKYREQLKILPAKLRRQR